MKSILAERVSVQRKPELLLAHFGANAGIIGSAIMALDLLLFVAVSEVTLRNNDSAKLVLNATK